MTVKVHHAEKSSQLLDILRGEQESISAVCLAIGGQTRHRNRVTENFQDWNCKNTFLQIDGKAIGGQGGEKCFQVLSI